MNKNNVKTMVYIVLTMVISLIFILLGFFVFKKAYLRLFETMKGLILSLKYFFAFVLDIKCEIPPISDSIILRSENWFPTTLDNFWIKLRYLPILLFDETNFVLWFESLNLNSEIFMRILTFVVPVIFLLVILIKKIYYRKNNKYNCDTLPLKLFKKMENVIFVPVKRFILSYYDFLKQHSYILSIWIFIWILHFNLISVLVGFLAYYYYFVVSFDFVSMFGQLRNLMLDLFLITRHLPVWVVLIGVWLVFNLWRHKRAKKKLQHMEARNCGFINDLPIVSMTCGSMGKKKTTVITDMAISQAVMFRQKAFDILQSCDMKFPYFPWISFEKDIQKCMEEGIIYNLATIKSWMNEKKKRFCNECNYIDYLYGYDGEKYGLEFNDNLKINDLFDVLTTYAEAYFIYIIQSSIIVSNYSIRTDDYVSDEGNFPLWMNDFFPKGVNSESRFAKILDFDVLRLGKKVIENNKNAGSFEFGVLSITEVGKERGNNLELREVKKGVIGANQKNDLFNSWLKMCRHSATVDNFPFIKVFTDEQRPESWGADARDLCDILNIYDTGYCRIVFPMYIFEETITDILFSRFIKIYYDLRYQRGDNTLFILV